LELDSLNEELLIINFTNMKELDTYEKIALNSIAIDPTTTDDAYKVSVSALPYFSLA
jgi:hypothetical protein